MPMPTIGDGSIFMMSAPHAPTVLPNGERDERVSFELVGMDGYARAAGIDPATVSQPPNPVELPVAPLMLVRNLPAGRQADPNFVTEMEAAFRAMVCAGSGIERSLLEDPDPLLKAAASWSRMPMADRIACAKRYKLPLKNAMSNDPEVLKLLPDATLAWVADWQHLINTGEAWFTAGFIGKRAAELMDAGLCMSGPEPIIGFYGQPVASRSQIRRGDSGSPYLVRRTMGKPFMRWLMQIR